MAEKTTLCLTNLSSILTAAGSSLSKVMKMTVFLIDMGDFAEVNKEYERFFHENAGTCFPPRTRRPLQVTQEVLLLFCVMLQEG